MGVRLGARFDIRLETMIGTEKMVAETNGNRTESELTIRTKSKIHLVYAKELKQDNFLYIYIVSLYRIIRPHEYIS